MSRFLGLVALASLLTLADAQPAWAGPNVYHYNGTLAWNGTSSGNVYHSNGTLAWNGTSSGNVYHSNGTLAWNGTSSGNVYWENGTLAWNGTSTGSCYHPDGSLMQSSCGGITMSLGEGITLIRRLGANYVDVLGNTRMH